MLDNSIFDELMKLYHEKILTYQELTKQEKDMISNNLDLLKDNNQISEYLYSRYLVGFITNPSMDSYSYVINAIDKLKNLDTAKSINNYNDGYAFTEYERLLYHILDSNNVKLDDWNKVKYVTELENPIFVNICMQSEQISGGCKVDILQTMNEHQFATRDEFFQIIYGVATNEKAQINNSRLLELVKNIKDYGIDEETTPEQIAQYNSLLFLLSRDMKDIDEEQKVDLLSSSGDTNFIRTVVEFEYDKIGLNDTDKINLIAKFGNQELIESILKGETNIELGPLGMYKLIRANKMEQGNDNDYYLSCANNDEYHIGLSDKMFLIMMHNDKNVTKDFLESHRLKHHDQVVLLESIGDDLYSSSFISKQKEPFRMHLQDEYINRCGSEEEKKAWNNRIVRISNISELNEDKLSQLPDDAMIRIDNEETQRKTPQKELYSKEKYAKIIKVIDNMFEDVPPAIKGDKESEIRTFLEIYNRLGKRIAYDEQAITQKGEEDSELQISARNLEGGILNGQCVCAGYAEILRNVLAYKGIDAKYIDGHDSKLNNRTCMESSKDR